MTYRHTQRGTVIISALVIVAVLTLVILPTAPGTRMP